MGWSKAIAYEGLVTAESDVPADPQVVWGARVHIERGYG
jgi:hypothetical protein